MWTYGICWNHPSDQDKKCILSKNQHVVANCQRDITTVMVQWLHTNLLRMAWLLTLGTKPTKGICVGSEHNHGNISSLIGGKMLNFGMEVFFILFFLNIKTKLVISQIKFLWRHHCGSPIMTDFLFLCLVKFIVLSLKQQLEFRAKHLGLST